MQLALARTHGGWRAQDRPLARERLSADVAAGGGQRQTAGSGAINSSGEFDRRVL